MKIISNIITLLTLVILLTGSGSLFISFENTISNDKVINDNDFQLQEITQQNYIRNHNPPDTDGNINHNIQLEETLRANSIDKEINLGYEKEHISGEEQEHELPDTEYRNRIMKTNLQKQKVSSSDLSPANDTFVSTWNTTLISSGSSANNQITLPLQSTGTYDFIVDWGDGDSDTITSYNQAEVTHTYSVEGTYEIAIEGTLDGWQFDNGGDKLKIIEISRWGNISLGNSQSYFYGAKNLEVTAYDYPDLSDTTTLAQAFRDAESLGDGDAMINWNMSTITDMSNMFRDATSFNQDIWVWDVSNVIDMSGMFRGASSFNKPIGSWNVSSVTDMNRMFYQASSFNYSISDWDTSSVTDMNWMFNAASSFNQPIGNWNVSQVTGMSRMFMDAESFNQPIGDWNVSQVTIMHWMFFRGLSFNQPIGDWDTSSVTDMDRMFWEASSFNQPIGQWNVSGVTDLGYIFRAASSFNQSLNNWDVSGATNMIGLFQGASSFNQDISNWNVTNVTDMSYMFHTASSFDQSIGNWNVTNVTDMSYMFQSASSFDQDISNWNVSKVTNMAGMFRDANSFNQDISDWNVSKVTNMAGMFRDATSFNQDINNWNVTNVTDMNYMFHTASSFNQNISNWNVTNVTDMSYMFNGATSFNQSIGSWNVSSVTDMSYMFQSASSFDVPLGSWNVSSVTDMSGMFNGISLSYLNYDHLLNGWAQLTLENGLSLDAGNSRYSKHGNNSRKYIIDTFGWVITDGGLIDITLPDIDQPTDITYEAGSTGNAIEWTLGDVNPDIYNVTMDSSLHISDTVWSNGSITVDIDGLDVGQYVFAINVYDIDDNMVTDTVTVTVIDTTLPQINNPADITYEAGSTSNTIDWSVGDLNPGIYNITMSGSLHISDTVWSNGTITVDIDGLEVGQYTFVINVYDTEDNMVSDTVTVTVIDTTLPEINNPVDITYETGSTGNTIEWTVGDINPGIYNVTMNGSLHISDTVWSNGTITVDIDGLDVGQYTFVTNVYDTEANMVQDTVIITVIDSTLPEINNPADITYEAGSTGNTIEWTVGDINPSIYNVTMNGSLHTSDTAWSNGTVLLEIDGLDVGQYKFIINVYDTEGNMGSDTVTVTVIDTTLPEINNPADITYEAGSTGNSIDWLVGDINPGIYNVTMNGSHHISDTEWSNGTITVDIDGLEVGQYSFVINVFDTEDNMANNSVNVSVIDTTPPKLTEASDITYEVGSTGNAIEWTVGDINPGIYNVTMNGSLHISDTEWSNGTITVDIDGFEVGQYSFVINVYDTEGNHVSDTVLVTINISETDDPSNGGVLIGLSVAVVGVGLVALAVRFREDILGRIQR